MSEVLPARKAKNREGKLLIREAQAYIREVQEQKEGESRAESKRRIARCTGERLFKEEPRRYRLIVSMRSEGLGMRQTCRAAHCDPSTVASVEHREAESTPTVKAKLTRGFGQLARMSLERLQEEVPTMNQAQLAITAGIATDKFQTLTGDPNFRIEHTIKASEGNIFERIDKLREGLTKVIQARVIESQPLELLECTSSLKQTLPPKGIPVIRLERSSNSVRQSPKS